MSKPEKVEERKFARWVKKNGGKCIKMTTFGPYGEVGNSDRLILLPVAVAFFGEFKRVGEEPTKIQKYRHREYRKMGFKTYVFYEASEAIRIAKAIQALRAKEVSERGHQVRSVKTRGGVLPGSRTR